MQDINTVDCLHNMKYTCDKKAILIYDGNCDFCQGSTNWIKKRALPGKFEFIPCQSKERRERFPFISDDQCMTALQLILPDGCQYAGADAIPEILCRLEGWRWLEAVLRQPIIKKTSPLVYKWVAKHRGFLSCVFPRSELKNKS